AGEHWRESDAGDGPGGLSEAQLDAMRLPDTVLPGTIRLADGTRVPYRLTEREVLEATRALKGSMLRREVYGLDGGPAEDRPYTVEEANHTVELLQPCGPGAHAVVLVHPREEIEFHYERRLYDVAGTWLADPRVTHRVTLEADAFGNPTRVAEIAYGRRRDDPSLPASALDRARQRRTTVTYTEDRFTDPVSGPDDHRGPLPCASRTFELLNVAPARAVPGITNLFGLEELAAQVDRAADGAHDLPYEDRDGTGATSAAPYRRIIEHVRTLFRSDTLGGALALGVAGARALPFESYKQVMTPGLADRLLVGAGRLAAGEVDAVFSGECGYVQLDGDPDWWIPSGRVFFGPATAATAAQELDHATRHFFQPCRFRDPFHTAAAPTETAVAYDAYDLLPEETSDPLGNVLGARNHYRTLAAQVVTDANGNRRAARFDALGLVTMTFELGKPGDGEGDRFDDTADEASPADDPTRRIEYALLEHMNDPARRRPTHVRTLARVTHGDGGTEWQESFSYSDGFEREIQRKLRAEPGPLVPGGPVVAERWVGSGWAVFDNRGNPVRRYEPFFDDAPDFAFARAAGVSPILLHDPAGRVVATLHPDHSYEKVVFDPWHEASWDANDTVLTADPRDDPDVGGAFRRLPEGEYLPSWFDARQQGLLGPEEEAAAARAAAHAGTPGIELIDPLGRVICAIGDCGPGPGGARLLFATRTTFDVEGNPREVTDARGRAALRCEHDMLGARVHEVHIDAGARWTLTDAGGHPVRTWDSRGHAFRTEYDPLRRPLRHIVRGSDPARSDPDTLGGDLVFESYDYGEGDPGAAARNLRGRILRHRDGAGVLTNEEFDFKGNPLRVSRAVVTSATVTPDWGAGAATDPPLEERWTYDALDRVTSYTTPDGSVTRYAYNQTSQVRAIDADVGGAPVPTPFVRHVEYDAKGLRTLVERGNGVTTSYAYDARTFRLAAATTIRTPAAFPDDCPRPPPAGWPGCHVQNLRYVHDPVGNVTHVRDDAQQTIFFRNVRVDPSAELTYDP
ncbi:MAG: toxin TcdB middle/C-terminal domain-containing protein, partial [Thermoleophilia bacterium]